MGILSKITAGITLNVAFGYLGGKLLVKAFNKFAPTDWQV